jgi:hypothetical protein
MIFGIYLSALVLHARIKESASPESQRVGQPVGRRLVARAPVALAVLLAAALSFSAIWSDAFTPQKLPYYALVERAACQPAKDSSVLGSWPSAPAGRRWLVAAMRELRDVRLSVYSACPPETRPD